MSTQPITLFCFPYAGGGAATFSRWPQLLGPGVRVHAFQYPGRGMRVYERPHPDMPSLVQAVLDEIQAGKAERYAFFGHSFGAIVAFETARMLRRWNRPLPRVLFASAAESPQQRRLKRRMHDLPEDEFLAALGDYGGTPREVLESRELMELLAPGLRADFAISANYVYRGEPPLGLPIHVLGDEHGDVLVEAERARAWQAETTSEFRYHRFEGGHFFIDKHPEGVTAVVAEALGLARAGATSGS